MKDVQSVPVFPKRGPLLSWDIFMNGYQNMMQLADDRQALLKLATQKNWQHNFDFREHLFLMRDTIVVTDVQQKIVFASSAMFDMNGYQPEEVIGKHPKIFQGTETSVQTRGLIRNKISQLQPFEATVINYKKNGAPYECYIKGYPLFNETKQLVNFIAFEKAA